MKKSWLLLLIAVIVVSLTTFGWLSGNKKSLNQTSDKEIVLRLGHVVDPNNPRHLAAVQFAGWVNQQTNGRVKIEVFPFEILGSDKQMIDLIEKGDLDMSLALAGLAANYAPKIVAMELPFLFDSIDKVGPVLDGPIGEEIAKDMPEKGMRILAYWDNGLRHITNNKQPIEKPEDLKGLTFRTPESKMTMGIFKGLGAIPAPLPWGEVYLALAQGKFDGQENPVVNIYGTKLYEVQKYMSIVSYKYEASPLVINERSWQSLPPDIQKILKEGAVKFAVETRRLNREAEGKMLVDLEAKGMKVSRPDLAPFREATKPVYNEWVPVLGKDLIDKIVSAAK